MRLAVHWIGDTNLMDRWRPSSIRATGGGGRGCRRHRRPCAARRPPPGRKHSQLEKQKTRQDCSYFFARAGRLIPTYTIIQNPVGPVDSTARRPANRKKWSTQNQNLSLLLLIPLLFPPDVSNQPEECQPLIRRTVFYHVWNSYK